MELVVGGKHLLPEDLEVSSSITVGEVFKIKSEPSSIEDGYPELGVPNSNPAAVEVETELKMELEEVRTLRGRTVHHWRTVAEDDFSSFFEKNAASKSDWKNNVEVEVKFLESEDHNHDEDRIVEEIQVEVRENQRLHHTIQPNPLPPLLLPPQTPEQEKRCNEEDEEKENRPPNNFKMEMKRHPPSFLPLGTSATTAKVLRRLLNAVPKIKWRRRKRKLKNKEPAKMSTHRQASSTKLPGNAALLPSTPKHRGNARRLSNLESKDRRKEEKSMSAAALHEAAVKGDPKAVEFLLKEKNFDANITENQEGNTPLHCLCESIRVNPTLLKLQPTCFPDPDAYYRLVNLYKQEEQKWSRTIQVIKILLAHGADVETVNKAGKAPLQMMTNAAADWQRSEIEMIVQSVEYHRINVLRDHLRNFSRMPQKRKKAVSFAAKIRRILRNGRSRHQKKVKSRACRD